MGKSLELLGLVSLNVLVAMMLSVAFLPRGGSTGALTEANVRNFIADMSSVSAGERKDMDSYGIADYFMDHIAPDSVFKTTLRYNIPEMPENEQQMQMDKMEFISRTLQSMRAMDERETKVNVEYIQIAQDGRSAAVTTTNYERGLMPVDDGSGAVDMMPVYGTSYCEQKIVLTETRTIALSGATCYTDLTFSEGL